MERAAEQITDLNILSLIRENNLAGWGQLYDKYAPIMYGIIFTYTTDKIFSDKIFIDLFIRLKEDEILLKIDYPLCVFILRYTHLNTRKELKNRGIYYTEPPIEKNSILQTLCSHSLNLKSVAENLGMSEQEVKKNLRKEFLIFRSQNECAQPT